MQVIPMRPQAAAAVRSLTTARPSTPPRTTLLGLVAGAALVLAGMGTAAAQDEMPAGDFAVLVQGELFTADLDQARAAHDTVAAAGEEAARAAGDVYHLAAVGTTILGGDEATFLGVDRWTSPESIEAFYSDPAIAEAFGGLFAGPPSIELFERQPDWHSWGDMPDPTEATERWVAVVRGRLAADDPAVAQAGHDAVAAAAQLEAEEAGDIAHVVYTGLADPAEFLAFDVWERAEGIEMVYGDPVFQEAFATLFAEPPSLTVYRTTDWYQWP